MSRRRFIGGALAAAGVVAMPSALLAGCGGSSAGVPELVVDPATPWWLQNNFAPVADEVEAFDLPIRGALPPELSGVYARNGSNPQSGVSTHWFLGDGMVHGLRLEDGAARWYRNRYIDTEFYRAGIDYSNGGGAPLGGSHQANVSLIHHGGKLLASGEVGAPYIIDPETMETVGWTDFEGELSASFTAHAKIDPVTGYLHFFGYFFAPPYLRYYVADETGRVIHATDIPVSANTMMHSFAITESDVVFWEGPVLFGAAGGGSFPFGWDESYGARIGIMPLGGRGEEIRWVEIPPCYVFHELNAYRAGGDVVIDVSRHPEVMNGERIGTVAPRLHRWRVATGADELTFRDEVLADDIGLEFPYGDKRILGRRHRDGWFVEFRDHPDTLDLGGIVHFDMQTGARSVWDPGLARQAGEATFVPGGAGEGEGWLLSIVYDRAAEVSDLVVLDPLNVASGPVAEVRLPQRVPFGFHGTWVADADL